MSNGFFQIGCTPGGTILKIFRASNGGSEVETKEIVEYLNSQKILFSIEGIKRGLSEFFSSDKPEKLILLNKDSIEEVKECYILKASVDKMTLTARFYPPSMKGKRITADEFLLDLKYKKVNYGIEEEAIRAFFNKPQYATDFVVANGRQVKQGSHARIEYYFETDLSQKPALNEDGSVDFFNLKTFTQCKQGDILAKLYPEERGEAGMTVFGEPVPPLAVKRKALKYGRNIDISEDGRILTAQVSGHVSLVEGKVFLSDNMELDNVGPATGNIDYEGSITVLGNVQENFSVKAQGSVIIKGVVEGAQIEAGEDIIIARGMNGMNKGVLKAGRNIIAKFIENAEVFAAGYVETDSILHSEVSAGTEVIVSSHKGFITGGRVIATNSVKVRTLGSDMGADTIIEVGADPEKKRRMMELQKLIPETSRQIAQSKPTIDNFAKKLKSGQTLSLDQKMYMQSLLTSQQEKTNNLKNWQEELDEIEAFMENTSEAMVEVSGDVYPGTKICISDVSMTVKNSMTYCRFKKVNGDVKMSSL